MYTWFMLKTVFFIIISTAANKTDLNRQANRSHNRGDNRSHNRGDNRNLNRMF